MATAQGIRKQTIIGKQVALGTPLVGAGGQVLRRESSSFTLTKGMYESTEIVTHQQSTGARHGVHATAGKLAAIMSPGTYKLFWAALCRKDFAVGVNSGALITVTAASTGGANGTFTRSAGSWLTDGFKIGDIVRWTGWATTGVPNNAHNMMITALTATVMTVKTLDAVAIGAKAAGDSVTATVHGKKTLAPVSGHTDDYFTVEEWYPDITQSELFPDSKINQAAIELPGSGNAKANFDFVGLSRTLGTAQSFTTPTAETTSGILAAVSGIVMANGAPVGLVTGLQFSIDSGLTADGPVVGSNFSPSISRGRIKVSGQFSVYFTDNEFTTLFQNETVTSLHVALTSDSTPGSEFLKFSLPKIKLSGDAPDDGEKGILRTLPFTAEYNDAGGTGIATDQTILSIQDSLA